MKKSTQLLAFAMLAAAMAGCSGGATEANPDMTPVATNTGGAPAGGDPMRVTGAATTGAGATGAGIVTGLPGIPVAAVADPDKVFKTEEQLVASRYGGARKDPFALKSAERSFEIQQNSARLLNEMGSWTLAYTPPVEKAPDEGLIQDPQPYRRLSGIIVGDSVYAIMDSGDGNPVIIRPGMRLPNSEWEVVSIDEEKAVLRRKGNKIPRQITVRLESPPPGMGGNSGSPAMGSGPSGSGPAGSSGPQFQGAGASPGGGGASNVGG